MTRLSIASRRHDPYWDMDGAGVQRLRTKRRVIRWAVWFLVLAALVFVATHVPSFDADFVIRGEGRPVMAAALLGLLGSAAILALARVRQVSRD
ncbi:MAG TPA: hypothetical protein VN773_02235 [Verrucomicrobiae bacterium]|nr:hypothetical protein [Verrucomicrobiae bacterium]